MAPVLTVFCGVAIVGGASGFGSLVARQIRRRPAELAALQGVLEALRTEIAFARSPLPQALRQAATGMAGPAAVLCQVAAAGLERGAGENTAAVWAAAVAAADAASAWAPDDRAALGRLGTVLGASDVTDQVRHIALCAARLHQAERTAAAGAERQARMWVYLGVLAGAGLLIAVL